ncbi:alpha-ketoglutarate-dependent sulfonate dioxygenase [Cladophialophora carrionii]|uniref:Alpha-ketoglutarate-dependent sulfonate dioxygenase n=1 Tax=Cladophialophora carrionii TaxID=86049 RepID=A0A1C1C6Q2_9EURO|nr:alpha-ketoglutarate-dependent sulfonate dioxygenase [Cladophialophora carrionii]
MGSLGETYSNGHSTADDHGYPRKPLRQSGLLNEKFESDDLTPVIGREFPKVNIVDDLLNSPDADTLLRDLAITISERGVVFFRAQTNLTDALQKVFIQRMGELTNKPSSSTLHIHPVLNGTSEFGHDNEISTISSVTRKKLYGAYGEVKNPRRYDAAQWHSDIQFETCPADYTSLRLTQLPKNGGDTLWASGYEVYDRFSPTYQRFLEGLTATFVGDGFIKAAEAGRTTLYDQPRGSPQNVGKALTAVHPVVRTNPITGWKSVFAIGTFPKVINELNPEESDELLAMLKRMVVENHDLQVRFKWRNEHDIAIWDNRSAFHCATFDYDGLGERFGNRAVGIGEAPYFDPNSQSRTEALGTAL